MKSVLEFDAFFVGLFNANHNEISFPITYDSGRFWQEPTKPLASNSWVAMVIKQGEPLLINRTQNEIDASSQKEARVGDHDRPSASAVMAPLSIGDETIGVISVQGYSLNTYNEHHVELLMGAAYQISIAVENARLYDSLRTELMTRQQAEQEVVQLNAELEQRVEQRTAELALVNKELEAFAYSISHDLRAPLRSIDGFSRMVMETNAEHLDDAGQSYLDRIRSATQRMGDMIDALLTLSRVTRSDLYAQPVDLSAMALDILSALQETDPDRQVKTVIQPDVRLKGDSRLLRIMLENLLSNAWKYSSQKPLAQIELGTEVIDSEPTLFIRDNGAGFDEQYMDKLFGVFQRLHSEREFPGTGVGLATVQRIIHRHGGKIWATAAVDEGSTFFIQFPAGYWDDET